MCVYICVCTYTYISFIYIYHIFVYINNDYMPKFILAVSRYNKNSHQCVYIHIYIYRYSFIYYFYHYYDQTRSEERHYSIFQSFLKFTGIHFVLHFKLTIPVHILSIHGKKIGRNPRMMRYRIQLLETRVNDHIFLSLFSLFMEKDAH